MANFYVDTGDTQRTGKVMKGEWAANTAYSLGDLVVPTRAYGTANAKKYVYECTTAGTSHATTQPTWVYTTPGTSTTSDGTVTWTCQETSNVNYSTYYLDYLFISGAIRPAAGDNVLVLSTYAGSVSGANITFSTVSNTGKRVNILSVDSFSSPVLTPGASFTITSNHALVLNHQYAYGVTFAQSGAGASQTINAGSGFYGEECRFEMGSSSGSLLTVGAATLKNCVVKTGSTGQFVSLNGAKIIGPSDTYLIDNTGTIPTGGLFRSIGGVIEGADLSNVAQNLWSAASASTQLLLVGCKRHASDSITGIGNFQDLICVGSNSGDDPIAYQRVTMAASETEDATIYRSGGAGDGTNTFSRKIVTTAACSFTAPHIIELICPNVATGSAKNATVYWVQDNAGALNNLNKGEAWLEVDFFGTAGSTLRSVTADACGDALTPSAVAQNTDGSSTWTGTTGSPKKQYAQVSITPQEIGYIKARLYIAKASTTIYLDPVLYLS